MSRKKKAEVKHLWASDFQPGLVANEKDAEEEERQRWGGGRGEMLVAFIPIGGLQVVSRAVSTQ